MTASGRQRKTPVQVPRPTSIENARRRRAAERHGGLLEAARRGRVINGV